MEESDNEGDNEGLEENDNNDNNSDDNNDDISTTPHYPNHLRVVWDNEEVEDVNDARYEDITSSVTSNSIKAPPWLNHLRNFTAQKIGFLTSGKPGDISLKRPDGWSPPHDPRDPSNEIITAISGLHCYALLLATQLRNSEVQNNDV